LTYVGPSAVIKVGALKKVSDRHFKAGDYCTSVLGVELAFRAVVSVVAGVVGV
jgi:hypothetical protein